LGLIAIRPLLGRSETNTDAELNVRNRGIDVVGNVRLNGSNGSMTAAAPGEPNGCNRVATAEPTVAIQPCGATPQFAPRSPRVIDFNSEVSDGALKFRMAEQ
jgi:hypothetical protein